MVLDGVCVVCTTTKRQVCVDAILSDLNSTLPAAELSRRNILIDSLYTRRRQL